MIACETPRLRAMTSNRRSSAPPGLISQPQLQDTTTLHPRIHNTHFIKLLLTNVFGLSSKFAEFQHTLRTSGADVAIVTETKLTLEKMSLSESTINGFHAPLRLDRTAQGGGVAVWIKDDIAYEHLTMLDCGNHEILWLSINLAAQKKLVLGAIYRPGSASGQDISLLEYLDANLDSVRHLGSNIILAGDFNVHNEPWLGSSKTTPAGEYMEELCAAHGLTQHVESATRGKNPLDLILSDFGDGVTVKAMSPIGSSDHITLLASICISPRREKRTSRQVWRYSQADWGRLCKFYRDVEWCKMITNDPENACSAVTKTLLEGMNRFIPAKRLVTRPSDPSWWSPECTAAVRAKQRSWKRFRMHPSNQNEVTYKICSAECAARIRHAKALETARLRQRLQSGSLQSKQWWSSVKQAGGDGRHCSIPVIRDNQGREHSTSQEKADCFGRFFARKCSLEGEDFQQTDLPNFPNRCPSTLSQVRFRPATVERQLRRLDPSKATGNDSVPSRVLKQCAPVLALPLSRLFSLCIRHGTQPSMWKIANVVPVHKKQSRSEMRNYRPVSLLSVLSKVMEKIVNTSIMNHLEKENLLSSHQFGFRAGLGAADLLTGLSHEWLTSINAGESVRVLAVDIAGAFDKVSHVGVLHKLRSYGIHGALHRWLTNYLSNRKLQAVVGGAKSQLFPVTAGVPQGSILGPTLFLVYVNDAADVLPVGISPATYADDTTIYSRITSAETAANQCKNFQTGVDNLAKWGATWRVKFEPSKSQAMTISRHRNPWPIPPVRFNGLIVQEVNALKLLGVTFDKHLNYGQHLRATALRATQRIGFLRKASRVLGLHGRAVAYKGFVRPMMEYCPLVWSGAAACHLSRLEKAQKRALSLIGPGAIVDSLALRRTVSGLCFLYKLYCGPRLPSLQSLLPPPAERATNPRTRRQLQEAHPFKLQLNLPARSLDAILKSFPYGLIRVWNSLPRTILAEAPQPSRLQSFKLNVYKHLVRTDWIWATATS